MDNLLPTLSLLLAGLFLIAYCHRSSSWPKSVVKTLSVLLLAIAVWASGGPVALTIGLALGAAGDFFLSRDGTRAFVAGLVAFALGHLAYVGLIWQSGGHVELNALTIGFAALAGVMGWVLVPRAGGLAIPVFAYIVIIAMMGVLAIGLPANMALGTAAALLFAVSDCLLGLSLFVLAPRWKSNWPLSAAIWTAYFGAQALFLLAFGGVFGG